MSRQPASATTAISTAGVKTSRSEARARHTLQARVVGGQRRARRVKTQRSISSISSSVGCRTTGSASAAMSATSSGMSRVVPATERCGAPGAPRAATLLTLACSAWASSLMRISNSGHPPRLHQRLLQLGELDVEHLCFARCSSAASQSAHLGAPGSASAIAGRMTPQAASPRSRAAAPPGGSRRRRGRAGARQSPSAKLALRWPIGARCPSARRALQARRPGGLRPWAARPKARKNGGMPIITSVAITVSVSVTMRLPRWVDGVGQHLQGHQRVAGDHLADRVGVQVVLALAHRFEQLLRCRPGSGISAGLEVRCPGRSGPASGWVKGSRQGLSWRTPKGSDRSSVIGAGARAT